MRPKMSAILLSLVFLVPLTVSPALVAYPPARKGHHHAGLTVDGDVQILVTKTPFRVVCGEDATLFLWQVPAGWKVERKGNVLVVTEAAEGANTVSVTAVKIDHEAKKTTVTDHSISVVVGKVVPPAPLPPDPGPNPPGPNPPPTPPGPTPTIGPLKVLILFESGKTYPGQTGSILTGKKVRDYLKEKTYLDRDKATDGRAYRIWDKDVQPKVSAKFWQDAVARYRSTAYPKHPYLMIYREGDTPVHEGDLPPSVDETLKLLKKYGG